MKLDAFEKIIRKIVREEIEYSIEKLMTNSKKNENITHNKQSNSSNSPSLSEFRERLNLEYNNDYSQNGAPAKDWTFEIQNNEEFSNAPSHLKEALTRDYSDLVKKFKK